MRVTFILADVAAAEWAAMAGTPMPQRQRSVTIELTPEQEQAVRPRSVGIMNGKEQFEEYVGCFVEAEPPRKD